MNNRLNEKYVELFNSLFNLPKNEKLINENLKNFIETLVDYCSSDQEIFTIYRLLKEMDNDLNYKNEKLDKFPNTMAHLIIGKIQSFIATELEIIRYKIKDPSLRECNNKMGEVPSLLNWTDKKVALVELIYSLTKSINNGNISIRRIVKCFEFIFQVDLGNYYDIFDEICIRKINPTRYLDSLINNLKEAISSKIN